METYLIKSPQRWGLKSQIEKYNGQTFANISEISDILRAEIKTDNPEYNKYKTLGIGSVKAFVKMANDSGYMFNPSEYDYAYIYLKSRD